MGVKLTLQLLADHIEADRKHAKIVVFPFSTKAGSQASQKEGGTIRESDPPDAKNRVVYSRGLLFGRSAFSFINIFRFISRKNRHAKT